MFLGLGEGLTSRQSYLGLESKEFSAVSEGQSEMPYVRSTIKTPLSSGSHR